jgi:hypothetical protein
MTLQEAKNEVIEREKLAHKNDYKMFYPDPCEPNDCAQCGKAKELHIKGYDGRQVFCQITPTKRHEQLMDEAAELYAQSKLKWISADERLPEHGQKVAALIKEKDNVCSHPMKFGIWDDEENTIIFSGWTNEYEVIYWFPIPLITDEQHEIWKQKVGVFKLI